MKNTNNDEILKNMPVHTLYNIAGVIPAFAEYHLTFKDVQDLTLEVIREFVKDFSSVSCYYEKSNKNKFSDISQELDKDGNPKKQQRREEPNIRLYACIPVGSPSLSTRFGDDVCIAGNDNSRSPELKRFLERFAVTYKNPEGFAGVMQRRTRPGAMITEDKDVYGFELDITKIMQLIFDGPGTEYASASGTDKKIRSTIWWGEAQHPKTGDTYGIYVRKYANTTSAAVEENGTYRAPKQARTF